MGPQAIVGCGYFWGVPGKQVADNFCLKILPMEHISLNGLDQKQHQDNVFSGCLTLTMIQIARTFLRFKHLLLCNAFPLTHEVHRPNVMRNLVGKMSWRLSFAFESLCSNHVSVPNWVCLSPPSRLFALIEVIHNREVKIAARQF